VPWESVELADFAESRGKQYSPYEYMTTISATLKKLHRIFNGGLSPMTAFIIKAHCVQEFGTVHPSDACTLLNKLVPKSYSYPSLSNGDEVYEPECEPVQEIRGALHFGHMFNFMCMAFLRTYFYSQWIFCAGTWVEYATDKTEAEPDLWEKPFPAWSHKIWVDTAEGIVKKAKGRLPRFMPIERILFSRDPLALYHYFGFEAELGSLFPHFLLHNRLEQEQMVICMWFLRQREMISVDIMIWLCML
jgi:hypothetical protein